MNANLFAFGRVWRIIIGAALISGVFFGSAIGMPWLNPWGWIGVFPLVSALIIWPRRS